MHCIAKEHPSIDWKELEPKRRMYKGCENCKHYQNRICMMTGEELAMVCEEWEAKDEQD